MQYTIEARELTTEFRPRPSSAVGSTHMTIEARTADEAISQFIRDNDSELVSLTRPIKGMESIATVKKDDAVFLLRVYAA